MSEQTIKPEPLAAQQQAIAEFNASVDKGILAMFDLNKTLMDDGVSATAVALSNALAAADLTAAIVVETGEPIEVVGQMLDNLLADMKARAAATYKFYLEKKAA